MTKEGDAGFQIGFTIGNKGLRWRGRVFQYWPCGDGRCGTGHVGRRCGDGSRPSKPSQARELSTDHRFRMKHAQ